MADEQEIQDVELQDEEDIPGFKSKPLIELFKHVDLLAGIAGFGLYLAQFYLLMVCRICDASALSIDQRGLVFVFLLGEAFIAIILFFVSKKFSSFTSVRTFGCFAAIAFVLPGLTSLLPLPSSLFYVVWFLAGMGAVGMLAIWGFFLASLNHGGAIVFTALSSLVGCIVVLLVVALFKGEALPVASIAIPLMSFWLFVSWSHYRRKDGRMEFPKNARPYNATSLLQTTTAMVANSFLLGYGFSVAASADDSFGICAVVIAMLCAAIYKVYDVRHGFRYRVRRIITVIAPVAAIVILLTPFVDGFAKYLVCAFAMLFAMINEITCWSSVSEYMHIYQIQPIANMAFGRSGDIIGLALGYVFGLLTFMAPFNDYRAALIRAIVVILLVSAQAFIFRDNSATFYKGKLSSGEEDDDEIGVSDRHLEHRDSEPGAWRKRIETIAQHYELTSRQAEVLMLLAKGYSTAKIEEVLVVSNHTVKAHVYGIYQKTEVHSRQELIDLIEHYMGE